MNGNLFNLIFPQMNPAAALSTGVAHDEIDKLIEKPKQYRKGEFKPSSLDVFGDAHKQSNILPIDMESFTDLFKMGFSKDALKGMIKAKRFDERMNLIRKDGSFSELPASTQLDIVKVQSNTINRNWSSRDESELDKAYNKILGRMEKGDAPGGLVAYAFPDYKPLFPAAASYTPAFAVKTPQSKFLNEIGINIDNPKDVPDTLNFYARNLQQFFGGDSRDNLLESLYHEPVHAAYLHRTEQGDDWGEERGYEQKSYGQKYFDVATNRMISDFEDKITRDGTLNAAEKENKMNQMIENIFNLSKEQLEVLRYIYRDSEYIEKDKKTKASIGLAR